MFPLIVQDPFADPKIHDILHIGQRHRRLGHVRRQNDPATVTVGGESFDLVFQGDHGVANQDFKGWRTKSPTSGGSSRTRGAARPIWVNGDIQELVEFIDVGHATDKDEGRLARARDVDGELFSQK